MPTTVSSTIGSGRDYSTLQAWEDAAPANLVTSDQIWEGLVYAEGGGTNGEWTSSSVLLTVSGSTVDSTRYKRLAAAAGESFADAASPVLRYDTAQGVALRSTGGYGNGRCITVGESYFQLEGIQAKSNTGSQSPVGVNSSLSGWSVERCVLEAGTRTNKPIAISPSGSGGAVENTVLIGDGAHTVSSPSYTNCTFFTDQSTRTFSNTLYGSTSILKNCAVFGFTSEGSGVNASSSYNATSLSSFTGSNNQTSLTASSQFENSTYGASLDLRIKTGSALIDAGTSSGAPAVDIFGTSRPQGSAYDIGAHELAAAGTVPALSLPTVTAITTTGARLGLTLT